MKNAMQATTKDVMTKFNSILGYVQSDEITLVFKPKYNSKEEFEASEDKSEHIFGGKRDKLISVMAGYISAKFNYHINNEMHFDISKYTWNFIQLIKVYGQHFDGRLIIFESNEMSEMLNISFGVRMIVLEIVHHLGLDINVVKLQFIKKNSQKW